MSLKTRRPRPGWRPDRGPKVLNQTKGTTRRPGCKAPSPFYDVSRVKRAIDPRKVFEGFVDLKTGRGKCPICRNRNNRTVFSANLRTGVWKCFRCNQAGDIFRFVMLTQDVGFVKAVTLLAERSGVLPENSSTHGTLRNLAAIEPQYNARRKRTKTEAARAVNDAMFKVLYGYYERGLIDDIRFNELLALNRETTDASVFGDDESHWLSLQLLSRHETEKERLQCSENA